MIEGIFGKIVKIVFGRVGLIKTCHFERYETRSNGRLSEEIPKWALLPDRRLNKLLRYSGERINALINFDQSPEIILLTAFPLGNGRSDSLDYKL